MCAARAAAARPEELMANPASRDQFAAVKGVDTLRGVSRNHMTRLVPTLAAAALLVAGSAVNAAAQLIKSAATRRYG